MNQFILPFAVVLGYFALPISTDEAPIGGALGLGVVFCCLGMIGWVVYDEQRRGQRQLRPMQLLLAFELVLVLFALGYFVMAIRNPGEFEGLNTRLDALYFSLTTMTTVGYGDIHAVGQNGRLLVTVQLAFSLVFVASVLALFQERVRKVGVDEPTAADPATLSQPDADQQPS
ncbi:MAG: two pore domain potassium channel family protein [Micropruina sp.]|nr:two pore domain potassium channel family protein [Micropruina sp.]